MALITEPIITISTRLSERLNWHIITISTILSERLTFTKLPLFFWRTWSRAQGCQSPFPGSWRPCSPLRIPTSHHSDSFETTIQGLTALNAWSRFSKEGLNSWRFLWTFCRFWGQVKENGTMTLFNLVYCCCFLKFAMAAWISSWCEGSTEMALVWLSRQSWVFSVQASRQDCPWQTSCESSWPKCAAVCSCSVLFG